MKFLIVGLMMAGSVYANVAPTTATTAQKDGILVDEVTNTGSAVEKTRVDGIDARDETKTMTGKKLQTDKTQFRTRMEKKLERVDTKMNQLENRVSDLSGDARESLNSRLEYLKGLERDIRQKLAQVKNTTSGNYVDLKVKVEDQVQKLSKEVDSAFD